MQQNHIDLDSFFNSTKPVTWLFAGDSITQGAVHTRGWRDYTQLFKERLGEMARNEDLVLNTAVGGWSTAALEPRLEERILRHRPDAIFLMFGTNDAAAGDEGLNAFGERYRSILERIQNHGVGHLFVPALTHNTFLAPRRAGMAANRRRTYQNNGLRGKNQAGDGAAIAAERSEWPASGNSLGCSGLRSADQRGEREASWLNIIPV